VSQGIIVIEAGGNGSNDLDAFRDVNGKAILNRGSADFQDSGAIMVGAASSAAPHSRLSFSNYGSRIDCFAWGENITTCGDGWTGNATNAYTAGFGGTSGATPMVTGSTLLVQSWRVGAGLNRHEPAEMRSTLSASSNTASAAPALDRIGVMPDLKAIVTREGRARWIRYFAWAWMLVIGGLLITPGGVFCIRCGPASPGFIGDGPVIALGLVSIALGIAGIAGLVRAGARASG
jgi:Subtilase family